MYSVYFTILSSGYMRCLWEVHRFQWDTTYAILFFSERHFSIRFTCVHFSIKIFSWSLTSLSALVISLVLHKSAEFIASRGGKIGVINSKNVPVFCDMWPFFFVFFSPFSHRLNRGLDCVRRGTFCLQVKVTKCMFLLNNNWRPASAWASEQTSKGEDQSSADSQNSWTLPGRRVSFSEGGF